MEAFNNYDFESDSNVSKEKKLCMSALKTRSKPRGFPHQKTAHRRSGIGCVL